MARLGTLKIVAAKIQRFFLHFYDRLEWRGFEMSSLAAVR